VSTEFETNSKWKATCVDLCQKCQLCCLKGKQPKFFACHGFNTHYICDVW